MAPKAASSIASLSTTAKVKPASPRIAAARSSAPPTAAAPASGARGVSVEGCQAMRTPVLLVAALVLSACDLRSFDAMSDEERLAIGSARLERACVASDNAHELGFLARIDIERGHDYLAYVTAHSRAGELERHVAASALTTCLEVEGWRGELWRLILAKGTDQQVEALVQSTASPRIYCGLDLARHHEPEGAERIVAACERLGLR